MTEPVSTLIGVAAGAYLSKDGVERLLGPTADYLGEGLRDFTKRRAESISKIFGNAQSKLGEKLDSYGEVPPKVLKSMLNEGSFSNDILAVEYFGGILASSRTEMGRDDRGARLAKVVDSLSTYQLRSHYLIYSTIRALFKDKKIAFDMDGRPQMEIFIPYQSYYAAMDFSPSEQEQSGQLLNHTFFGLSSENLIRDLWRHGSSEFLKSLYPRATENGIVCTPSALGAELYLSAFGYANKPLSFIMSPEFSDLIKGVPSQMENAIATKF
jgi:hypothetical protein